MTFSFLDHFGPNFGFTLPLCQPSLPGLDVFAVLFENPFSLTPGEALPTLVNSRFFEVRSLGRFWNIFRSEQLYCCNLLVQNTGFGATRWTTIYGGNMIADMAGCWLTIFGPPWMPGILAAGGCGFLQTPGLGAARPTTAVAAELAMH